MSFCLTDAIIYRQVSFFERWRGYPVKAFFKRLICIALILAVVAVGGYAVLYFGFDIHLFDRGGWKISQEGYVQYLDKQGQPLTQWQQLDDGWYYFDPDRQGCMVTGWLELPEGRYYLDTEGKRQNGWFTLSDGTYYSDPTTGIAVTGWQTMDGYTYYFDENGRASTGWVDLGSLRFYFTDAGTLTTGWLTLDDEIYYLDRSSGDMATGLTEVDGQRYYFAENGTMCTGWVDTEEGTYCLDEVTGALLTGWVEAEGGLRYLDEATGTMVTGWLETDQGKLYLGEDGYICTGWTQTDSGTFYLSGEGYPLTGWVDEGSSRYYLDENGQMATGWLELENVTYYFREDGTMAIGKVLIDDEARYFSSTGAYVVMVNGWNPVPGDYSVDLVSFGNWQVSSVCYDALVKMLEDCPYSYKITSAYRSKESQQSIWTTRLYNYLNAGYSDAGALAMVKAYVAKPGYSEHQLGLAIDISGSDAVCGWLAEHCWEYGFILRYPEGKSEITGIAYERWHFRYLGEALAKEIRELDVTLEEYMDMLTASAGSDAGTASDPERFTNCALDEAA